MRQVAGLRCTGLHNVSVTGDALTDLGGEFDLVTMIAVLHHFDMANALQQVTRVLALVGVSWSSGSPLREAFETMRGTWLPSRPTRSSAT